MAQIPNLIPALPELFMAMVAMALLMLGVFQKAGVEGGEAKTSKMISYLSVVTLLLALLLTATVSSVPGTTFGGMFVVDPFSVYFKVMVLFASAISIIMAQQYLQTQGIARFEFAILILFATIGMLMMISANNLISLYLGLEMQSLSLYVIATFQRDDTRSTEAGLKYFVLGAVASGMLLYGSSLIYGFTGTTDFQALASLFHDSQGHAPSVGLIVGIVFIMAGLAFKVSAVPFHMWTPDVYEGAPTPVAAFFSVAPKIAALALFLRVMIGPFGDLAAQWQQIVIFISVASMILGAFAAINQTNIKRMMAYSSIGHVGYALIGLAVGNEAGVRGVMIYLAIYLFMNLGAFACILTMRRGDRMVEDISDLAGLSKTNPMLALALTIFMFSMAGIPPLAGFFGKLYIFLAAIEVELYALAIIGVLSSVVASYYYVRIIKVMYFDDVTEPLNKAVGKELGSVLAVTAIVIVFFIVYPGPVLNGAAAAAAALFAG
ncbi:MAG: NADH-quinone oxidoreductase subunit NuoN [Rhodospirillales bacterium]|nr:NADH-quinone oxidoreductase subunit NuoN [Rhodospirillales bacterium]